jgi:thiol:disulfide interchange protein
MTTSDSESVSLWVVLGQVAGGLFVIWTLWTGYNYFKPAEIPAPVAGNYSDTIQWYSIHDGEEEFKKGQKCILYDFTAHWCHFCKLQDAQVFQDKTQAAFINQHFIPITVMDLVQEQGKNPQEVADLQSKYSVRGFPTLVVRYPNDQWKKNVGFPGPDRIIQFLKNAISPN